MTTQNLYYIKTLALLPLGLHMAENHYPQQRYKKLTSKGLQETRRVQWLPPFWARQRARQFQTKGPSMSNILQLYTGDIYWVP